MTVATDSPNRDHDSRQGSAVLAAQGPVRADGGGGRRSLLPDRALGTSLDLERLRGDIDAHLARFLDLKSSGDSAARDGVFPRDLVEVLRAFLLSGGKRIRPVLCVIGHVAATGGVSGPLLRAAASLEMFHAVALVHDDVIDDSGTRRGRPTVHRTLAARNSGRPDANRLGVNAAILLGDLALVWSGELLHTAGLAPRQLMDALAVTDAMRTEVIYGQYLDVVTTGPPTTETARALKVCRYKTAKYTFERPLHLGAVLAGAPTSLLATLSGYALPVGEAFQLRDDLLGTFGDPAVTGKPRLDDLRDGKNTVLLTLAMQRADPSQQRVLHTLVGVPSLDESDAARIRRILEATGARTAVERLIHTRREQALHALEAASLPAPAEDALRQIAGAATVRTA